MLNLLKLDEEIQSFILRLEEADVELRMLTERKLRRLVMGSKEDQRRKFRELVGRKG